MPENFNPETSPQDDVFNWRILGRENVMPHLNTPTEPVVPSAAFRYDLFNRNVQEVIRYGSRDNGINLRWGDPGTANNIRFRRKANTRGPIVSGEQMAIGVKGGGYLRYQSDRTGINLGWSAAPVFEWKLVLRKQGAPIVTGSAVAIWNTAEKDFLFYDPRAYGINLKWVKDKGKYKTTWWEKVINVIVEGTPVVKELYDELE